MQVNPARNLAENVVPHANTKFLQVKINLNNILI